MEPIYERLGQVLKRARRAKGLTQAQLAERVKLGRTSIVNIERGQQRIQLHTLFELAEALEVEAAALLPAPPRPVPALEDKVGGLSAPEQDWIFSVVRDERSAGQYREETR